MTATPLYVDERLASLSPEARQEFLKGIVLNGLPPQGLASAAPPAVLTSPVASVPDGVFDPDVDLSPETAEGEGRYEWYTMPGGKRVCVHPVSPEDAGWLNRQAVREVRALGLLRDDLSPEEMRAQAYDAKIEVELRGRIYQAIACCRVGPLSTDAKVFRPEHARKLRATPGYLDAVQDIARLSDSLSSGKSEAALLREVMADFFGRMASWLGTWSSALSAGSCPTLPEILSDFAASVNSTTQQKTLSIEGIAALGYMLALPPQDEE